MGIPQLRFERCLKTTISHSPNPYLFNFTFMYSKSLSTVLLVSFISVSTSSCLLSCSSDSAPKQEEKQPEKVDSVSESSNKADKSAILIEGGSYTRQNPETGKSEEVKVASFYLDKNLTTVAEFSEFVNKTGYVTEAQKFGNSAVLEAGAWALKEGANYLYPLGRDKPKAEANHPATQVSWNDAVAYANWKGKRLPTEKEWEFAATNRGKNVYKFAWGDKIVANGAYLANTWQGPFPSQNTKEDGFEGTSPVGSFAPNALGLYDIGGNVWQFTSDSIQPTPQQAAEDPTLRRPLKGASFATDIVNDKDAEVFHHSSTTPETGVFHTGFRLAKDK